MASSSRAAGYLAPASTPAPLYGQPLREFVQAFIVGVTGLAGDLVRWNVQAEPPNIPAADTPAWCGFDLAVIAANTFPAVRHLGDVGAGDDAGVDELQNHEVIQVLASFYGLGAESDAEGYAARLRDGMAIEQNLAPLLAQGMMVTEVGSLQAVPTLLKERWLFRSDLPFAIGRQVDRRYAVRNVANLDGAVVASDGLVLDLETDF